MKTDMMHGHGGPERPAKVPEELIDRIRSRSKIVALDEGFAYARAGVPTRDFAVVASGRIRVYRTEAGGKEITLYSVGPGECCMLNVLGLLSELPSPADAVCECDVTAHVVPGATFRGWMRSDEDLSTYVFGQITRRISSVMGLVEEVAFRRVDERLAKVLLERSDGGRVDVLTMTHDSIASELGTAREVVSRQLKALERKGAVRLGWSRIEICDPELLGEIAS